MTTLQLLPVTTISGTTFAATQFIITSVASERQKLILPKIEPGSETSTAHATIARQSFNLLEHAKRDLKTVRSHQKKKTACNYKQPGQAKPASVSRRNARERNRVKQVNQGFVTLANHVPTSMRPKKLSKVETLKAAIKYISYLYQAVDQQPPQYDERMENDEMSELPFSLIPDQKLLEQSGATTSRQKQHADDYRLTASQQTFDCAGESRMSGTAYVQQPACYDIQACLLSPSPTYGAPSPSGSVGSSLSAESGDTDSGYDNCLSPGSEELLDFATWFCGAG